MERSEHVPPKTIVSQHCFHTAFLNQSGFRSVLKPVESISLHRSPTIIRPVYMTNLEKSRQIIN